MKSRRLFSLVYIAIAALFLAGGLMFQSATAASPTPGPTPERDTGAEAYAFDRGVYYGCRNSGGGFSEAYCEGVARKSKVKHWYWTLVYKSGTR